MPSGEELKGFFLAKRVTRMEEMRNVDECLIKKNVMERSNLEDLFVDVSAILKHVLNKKF